MFAPHSTHVHDIEHHCCPRHLVLHQVQSKVFLACEVVSVVTFFLCFVSPSAPA